MSSPEQLLNKQDGISNTGIRKQATLWFMIIGIIFIAANLRAPSPQWDPWSVLFGTTCIFLIL